MGDNINLTSPSEQAPQETTEENKVNSAAATVDEQGRIIADSTLDLHEKMQYHARKRHSEETQPPAPQEQAASAEQSEAASPTETDDSASASPNDKKKNKKEKKPKEKKPKEKRYGFFHREKFRGGDDDEPYIDPNDTGELSTLEVRHLVKKFGLKTAVNDASFSMKQGEIVGLLGPNGAGKTTIFYMIVGFIKPTKGDILLDNHTITYMQMFKRARRGICYLAQEASVFRKLTVEENIDAVLESLKIPNSEKRRRKEEVMTDLGITRLARQKAYSLSGGERRRTEIARALVLKPKFLLLDEPFAGVDPIAVADIQTIIYGLREKNIGVLITDHNVRETLRITTRAYIINLGNIFRTGKPDDLVNDPMVRKLYLGEDFVF
jgi:lipopolysaccharide export system ATP-binding protein